MTEELAKAREAYEAALQSQSEIVAAAIAHAEQHVIDECAKAQVIVDEAAQRLLTMKRISEITVN